MDQEQPGSETPGANSAPSSDADALNSGRNSGLNSGPPGGRGGRRQRRAAEKSEQDLNLGHIETFDDEPLARKAASQRGWWAALARLFGSGEPEIIDVEDASLSSRSMFTAEGIAAATGAAARRSSAHDVLDVDAESRLEERIRRLRALPQAREGVAERPRSAAAAPVAPVAPAPEPVAPAVPAPVAAEPSVDDAPTQVVPASPTEVPSGPDGYVFIETDAEAVAVDIEAAAPGVDAPEVAAPEEAGPDTAGPDTTGPDTTAAPEVTGVPRRHGRRARAIEPVEAPEPTPVDTPDEVTPDQVTADQEAAPAVPSFIDISAPGGLGGMPAIPPEVEPVPAPEPEPEPAPEPVPEPEPAPEPVPEPEPEPAPEPERPAKLAPAASERAEPQATALYREGIAYGTLPLRTQMLRLLRTANELGTTPEIDALVPATRNVEGLADQFRTRREALAQGHTPDHRALAATVMPTTRRARLRLERELERVQSTQENVEIVVEKSLGRRQRAHLERTIAARTLEQEAAKDRADTTRRAQRRRRAAGPTVRRRFEFGRQLFEITAVIAIGIALSMLAKTFVVQSFTIPSQSMENTLMIGDRIVVSKFTPRFFDLKRGEVVVFKDVDGWEEHLAQLGQATTPVAPKPKGMAGYLNWAGQQVGVVPETDTTYIIKRIIGLPGDTVECCTATGGTVVNGQAMEESFLRPGTVKDQKYFKITVEPGHVWLEGDNRGESFDSRFNQDWRGGGQVDIKNIVGVAKWVIFPSSNFGSIEDYPTIFQGIPAPGTNPNPAIVLTPSPASSGEAAPVPSITRPATSGYSATGTSSQGASEAPTPVLTTQSTGDPAVAPTRETQGLSSTSAPPTSAR